MILPGETEAAMRGRNHFLRLYDQVPRAVVTVFFNQISIPRTVWAGFSMNCINRDRGNFSLSVSRSWDENYLRPIFLLRT